MCMLKALILVGTYGDEAREWWWRQRGIDLSLDPSREGVVQSQDGTCHD